MSDREQRNATRQRKQEEELRRYVRTARDIVKDELASQGFEHSWVINGVAFGMVLHQLLRGPE